MRIGGARGPRRFHTIGAVTADGSVRYEEDFNPSGTVDATGERVTAVPNTGDTFVVALTVTDEHGASTPSPGRFPFWSIPTTSSTTHGNDPRALRDRRF